jgi:hypothetical protein
MANVNHKYITTVFGNPVLATMAKPVPPLSLAWVVLAAALTSGGC